MQPMFRIYSRHEDITTRPEFDVLVLVSRLRHQDLLSQDRDQDQDHFSQDRDQDQDLFFSRPRPRPRPQNQVSRRSRDQDMSRDITSLVTADKAKGLATLYYDSQDTGFILNVAMPT